ncbi:hypothetical protein CI102_10180 [Trichoderma harzianum]|nr:hypothetical protein CI102_10180 [Trichoderma harzianum]
MISAPIQSLQIESTVPRSLLPIAEASPMPFRAPNATALKQIKLFPSLSLYATGEMTLFSSPVVTTSVPRSASVAVEAAATTSSSGIAIVISTGSIASSAAPSSGRW